MRKPFEILLVEDNPADVEITLEAFRRSRSGNHVSVCRDGEEALDFLFQRNRFPKGGLAPRPPRHGGRRRHATRAACRPAEPCTRRTQQGTRSRC